MQSRAWLLLAAVAVLHAWNLGRPELTDTDEARSGVIVRDMVEHGRWFLPRTPDGYLAEKPPVYYIAAALLGTGELALRVVPLAAALGTLALAAWIAGLYGSPRSGWIAIAALAVNPIFLRWSRQAMVDMPLAFFVTASMAAALGGRAGRIRPATAAVLYGVSSALAVLTKGPLGLVLPAGIVAAEALVASRGRFWRLPIRWRHPALALLLAAGLPLAWYLPAYARGGREFLETCVLSENFRMPTGNATGIGVGHEKNPLYYFWNQLVWLFPLLPLVPELVRWLLDPKSGDARSRVGVWFVAGFLLFLAVANKRHYYLLPLQPAVAVMAALAADRAWTENRRRFLAWGTAATAGGLALGGLAGLVVALRPGILVNRVPEDIAAAMGARGGWIAAFALAAVAVSILQFASIRRGAGAMIGGVAALALLAVAGNSGLTDAIEGDVGKNRPFVARTAQIVGSAPVAVLKPFRTYGLHYYWPGPLDQVAAAPRTPGYLFAVREVLPEAARIEAVRKARKQAEEVVLVRLGAEPSPAPEAPR